MDITEKELTFSTEEVKVFVNAIKSSSEYDFSDYSIKSFMRRVDKVLTDNSMNISQLSAKVKSDREFLEKIVRDITVNTTEIFRDPKVWYTVRYSILPALKSNNIINIWHAGSSTGQEIYSMLILLKELDLFDKSNVYASDINTTVMEEAKKGVYKYRFNIDYLDNYDKVIQENPFNPEEKFDAPYSKYFDINKAADTIKMKPFLVNKPVFKKHDLVKDENVFYTKFDLIMCRNVLIYFNFDLQNRIFETFHNNLFQGGFLVLGVHESIMGRISEKFDKRGMIYKKK